MTPDRDLVLAFQAGDPTAYAEIYRRYWGLARRISLRLLSNLPDSEEAIQESMLRVYQGLDRFNGRYAVQAWVARITTNVCLDMLRAKARRPQNGDALGEDHDRTGEGRNGHDKDPGQLVVEAAERREVRDVLALLPEHHRVALVLREFEGMSHEQIAAVLGMTAPQVKALIHRAKQSFRRVWDPAGVRGRIRILIPLLWPAQVLRRFVNRVEEAGASASSPSVHAAVTIGGERVSAAATAFVVAGTIAVGAVAGAGAARVQDPAPRFGAVAQAPAEAEVQPGASGGSEEIALVAGQRAAREDVAGAAEGNEPPTAEDPGPADPPPSEPSPEPSPSPTEPPPAEPSPDPPATQDGVDGQPSADPTPAPPGPAPAWSLGVRSGMSTALRCGCSATPVLTSSQVDGDTGSGLAFRQKAAGAARDAEGDAAWRMSVEYWGSLQGSSGTLEAKFYLHTDDGWQRYRATAAVTSMTRTEDGAYSYQLGGSYEHLGGPHDGDPAPSGGGMSATLSVWADGTTLHAVSFTLS